MNLLMLSGDSAIAQGHQGAFYQLLQRFSRYWSRIDILTPAAPNATARILHENVYVHPATQHRILQPFFIRRKGAALLRERPYALVVSHDFGFFYNGIGAWWLLRDHELPYVSEIHHVEGYPRAVSLRERLWRMTAMRYLPFVGKHAAAIRVVNQHEVPDLLIRLGVPADKILVLSSLYLELDLFRPLVGVDKRYDVLFVGRLATNKGIFTLLEAIRHVVPSYPQLQVAIRGDGDLKPRLERYVRDHDLGRNIHFVPRLPQPQAIVTLYNQARMLVCASTVEGNPRVTIEAMACGVPVISTPVGIMSDVIRHGENGLLFQWDAQELAQHIRRLLDDDAERQRIGEAGRLSVQAYDAERTVAAYAHGYHDLIAHWRSAHDQS